MLFRSHKLGINGSPTAVLAYGDKGGAIGYLVGEENRGLEYMFIMMNRARHAVGIEGYAIAERAYQRALSYSRDRVQGRVVGDVSGQRASIAYHPDVQRMLLSMRSRIEAMRALSLYTASCADRASHHPDDAERAKGQRRVEVLTPIVKGWSTEVGNEVAGIALQVHGGMGFIEETGAAQHYRDARITTIYEGTTGIQAADLVGRKLLRDGGQMVTDLISEMRADLSRIADGDTASAREVGQAVANAVDELESATQRLLESATTDPKLPFFNSFNYLMLWGVTAGAWQMAKAAESAEQMLNSGEGSDSFCRAKILSALFYIRQILPQSSAFARAVESPALSSEDLEQLLA